ncbi:THO complex subunit 2 [Thelohanellus kitauei]|uniref:THO complex subunit 2 n=1 Tax=Thelohanellus kitauei TaxID=669202 RepID=A0A0C2MEM6_THEKT|nr:THO complex subunit 2 [Thelohanellus kitauei]
MDEQVSFSEYCYNQLHHDFFRYLKQGSCGDFTQIRQVVNNQPNCFETKYNGYSDHRTLIYDAFYTCVFKGHSPEKVASLIPQFFGDVFGLIPYCSSLLASFDILLQVTDSGSRENLLKLVSCMARFLNEDSLKEFLDPETLEQAGVIKSSKIFNQKLVRLKTKLFYKQKKFNLLREDSEGYSKLVIGFQSIPKLAEEPNGIKLFISRVISLIGCFSLDPYRVLDLLIDYLSFSNFNQPQLIVSEYLEHSGVFCLKEIFNFRVYHNQVSIKLWDVIVHAIKQEGVDLGEVYQILSPSDNELLQKLKIIEKNDEELLKRITSLSLHDSTKSDKGFLLNQLDNCDKVLLFSAFLLALDPEGIDFFLTRFPSELLTSFTCVVKSLVHAISLSIEPIYARLNFRLAKVEEVNFDYREIYKTPLFKLVNTAGFWICEDTLTFTKLIRTFLYVIKNCSPDEKFKKITYMTICRCFLPALTQSDSNCVLNEEIWGLIQLFPYQIRYKFYSYMEMHAYSLYRQLGRTKIIVSKHVKFICKRITKDTVKQTGRQLAKLSHANPVIVLSEIMNQICSFETMIIPIVECLKFLTPLSLDILSFEIIQFLSANSVTLTPKITSIPDVIQNIGTFAATVIRKYYVPTTGIMQYIANQLKDSNPLDLIVLREILQRMAGVEEQHLNEQQIGYLSGSDALQEEAGIGSSKSLRKYALKLRDSLVESNLTFPLYFLMCQQRQRLVYDPRLIEIPIKMVGHLYDQCHKTLVQYGRFISKYIPRRDFGTISKSFGVLQNDFGVPAEFIFFLVRHIFRNDVINTPKNISYIQAANKLLENYLVLQDEILSSKVDVKILHKLICVFWLLDSYDITLPKLKYDELLTRSQQTLVAFDDSKESTAKKTKEKDRLNNVIKTLTQDRDQQRLHVAYIKQWLFEIMSDTKIKVIKNEFSNAFYQTCVYPRCIFSPSDALYSAEFIFSLHDLRCPNFNTLSLLDKIFSENVHVISSLSEAETSNFGAFLNKIWQTLMPWHGSKSLFEQVQYKFYENCSKHPGFTIFSKAEQEKTDGYEFNNFRHLMYKWQYKQTKSFIFALESKDYIQIRNTIIILTKELLS